MELDYNNINLLSNTTKAYVFKEESLLNLLKEFDIPLNIDEAINNKKGFSIEIRKNLVEVLKEQYSKIDQSNDSLVFENIEKLLLSNTFTITTGQQLHIFGGPMMVHYKILHTILLCQKYKKIYPDFNFVPIFWLASEDHDFEEIQKLKIKDKNYTWKTDQNGSVGKFLLNELRTLLEIVKNDFKNSNLEEIINELTEFYYKFEDYATATQALYNYFYEKFGLIVLNPNNKKLKKHFEKIIFNDVFENTNHQVFNNFSEVLKQHNFKVQLKSKPINFFYLGNNKRIPIIKETEERYKIGEQEFTKEGLLNDINNNIENYSPNAVLRPLYQESILPNIVYIGGNAEISYWTQLVEVFKNNNICFPHLLLRKSVLLSNNLIDKKLKKLNLEYEDLLNINSESDFIKHQQKNQNLIVNFEKFINEVEKNINQLNNESELHEIVKNKYNYFKDIKEIIKNLSKSEYLSILELKEKGFHVKYFQERNIFLLDFYQYENNLIDYLAKNILIDNINVQKINI